MDRMIQASEKNKWRELDAVYIALEFGYLSNAIKEALVEPGLLEVEKGVFVPQAVEDVFFLLQVRSLYLNKIGKICKKTFGSPF